MKKIIFIILFLLITTICRADDISISAGVDNREIPLDGQITLTITVNGDISNIPQPNIPELAGFKSYSSGRSQNISIINGKVTSSVSFNYILVPDDIGDYTLGPFTVEHKGRTYSAGPINVKVTPRSGNTQPPSSYISAPQPQDDQQAQKPGKELFIETYVDKLRTYVNDQITLTFAFYQSVDLFNNPSYNPPSATGFWTEDMPPQKRYYKTINGTRYLVTEIKTALFATGPGEFTIGPARLEASVEDIQRLFSSRSPFDIFDDDPFGMFRRGKPVVLTTEPIIVEILPLPEEGRPLNFKGDVGNYDITAEVDKNKVEESQPVSLKIKIKGEGNIKTISSPVFPDVDDVKIYDSGISENIQKTDYIVQGEKIFEKVIIPKKPGDFTIGPIVYSYFNPEEKKYIVKKINPITINNKRSWFRVLNVFDTLIPCWWDDKENHYEHVSFNELYSENLFPLVKITAKIASISRMSWFSTEIAIDVKQGKRRFVAIDYVNDQCDMTTKSEARNGLPDKIVEFAAKKMIEWSYDLIFQKVRKKKYTIFLENSVLELKGLGVCQDLLMQK